MAYTDVSRRTLHHAASPERRTADTDDVRREHTRAGLVLAAAWSGLAVALGAYAIAQHSIGAVVLLLAVLAVLRVAWMGTWPDDDTPSPADREIRLLP